MQNVEITSMPNEGFWSSHRAGVGAAIVSFLTVLFDGIAYGMLLFIMSVALSVTMGMMNFVNMAQASFSMLGGYVMVAVTQTFGIPFLLSLPIAFVAVETYR